ncbi:MAG: hypothetical protein UT31_C0004G0006 [Parcubacteria group bacterium GW2011_GWF2_39_13b]|nr:MAG: hypothetical protein UT31_C0004G0006 [Parcubacteria group bacterium GW2011_GWF2_39_13b]
MLNIFQVKKHLDELTHKKAKLKKICFPGGGQGKIALACVKQPKKGLYVLYAVWEDNFSLRHAEILSCQKEFFISKARIIFHWLAIKFYSPEESGVGCNIYDIRNLCPGLGQTIKSCRNSRINRLQNICPILPD